MAGKLRKLTARHLSFLHEQLAAGQSAATIATALRDGTAAVGGVELAAVGVSDSLVSYHATTAAGRAAVERCRERLFGDARRRPSYWVGWRLEQLEAQLADIEAGLAATDEASERRAWHGLKVKVLGEMRRQLAGIPAPSPATGAKHLHLHRHAGEVPAVGEIAGAVAGRIRELAGAGLLPEVLTRIEEQAARPSPPGTAD